MIITLSVIGLLFLGLYLFSVGLVGLFGAKIPAKLVALFALIAGIFILLGIIFTEAIILQ